MPVVMAELHDLYIYLVPVCNMLKINWDITTFYNLINMLCFIKSNQLVCLVVLSGNFLQLRSKIPVCLPFFMMQS